MPSFSSSPLPGKVYLITITNGQGGEKGGGFFDFLLRTPLSSIFQHTVNFSKQSLEELGPIVLMLKEVKGSGISEVPIMLVGNKKDEESVRHL